MQKYFLWCIKYITSYTWTEEFSLRLKVNYSETPRLRCQHAIILRHITVKAEKKTLNRLLSKMLKELIQAHRNTLYTLSL